MRGEKGCVVLRLFGAKGHPFVSTECCGQRGVRGGFCEAMIEANSKRYSEVNFMSAVSVARHRLFVWVALGGILLCAQWHHIVLGVR